MTRTKHTTKKLTIVASSGAAKRIPPGYLIASWSDLIPRDLLAFSGAAEGDWPLPELSQDEKEALLARYNDIIANTGLENGADSAWWYTWSSCRDRFNSRILADMELLARLDKGFDAGIPDRLVLLCPDPYLADALVSSAKRRGFTPRISSRDRVLWAHGRFRMKAAPLIYGLKICARAFIIKLRVGKFKTLVEEREQALGRTLLVTWIKAKDLLESTPPTDTYFGPLPEYMAQRDHVVMVFGDLLDRLPPRRRGYHSSAVSPVVTRGSVLSTWDILSAHVRAFASRISVPASLNFDNPKLASLVRRDIYANRGAIVSGLLFERALGRVAKSFRPTQIIHSCENNPWERACSRVASTMTPKPEVAGYMHCAVLLSHTKIIITEKEKLVRPRPQRVICTGTRARDIMVRFGGHSPDEVEAGCALRYGYLWQIPPRKGLNRPVQNILVVLEGLPTMSWFIRFVYDALAGGDKLRTTIRTHPSYKFDRLFHAAGLSESDLRTLRISDRKSIMDDFADADLVVYKGSTAAIEAGYLGIPLIHVESQNILTDDPLFEITSLKQVVRSPEQLIPAIHKFTAMEDGEFYRQHEMLQKYIEEYLTMPKEGCAEVFLPRQLKVGAS